MQSQIRLYLKLLDIKYTLYISETMTDKNAERGRKRKTINPGQEAGSKIQKNSLISIEGARGPVEFHSDAVKSGFTNFGDGNDIHDVIGINYNSSTSTPNSKSEKGNLTYPRT